MTIGNSLVISLISPANKVHYCIVLMQHWPSMTASSAFRQRAKRWNFALSFYLVID